MSKGILGVTNIKVEHVLNEPVHIDLELIAYPGYDPHHLLSEEWKELFPGNAVVKCEHCGQWAARKTSCKSCGASVD